MMDSVEPRVERICDGGGVSSNRKAIGNASCRRVFVLKSMRMSPDMKIGRARMWYSRGVKVYEPYQ